MGGTGIHAELISKRFDLACRRIGLNRERQSLDTSQFKVPGDSQLALF
jgi:hypothetical protein